MTPQQIVGLAVRLFSLWLGVMALEAGAMGQSLKNSSPEAASVMLYLMPVLFSVLAAVCWMFPMTIAHKLVPRTHETNTLNLQARQAAAVGAAIIGLWAMIGALPKIIAIVGMVVVNGGGPMASVYFASERALPFFIAVMQCVLGLFLVLNPSRIAGWIFPPARPDSGT